MKSIYKYLLSLAVSATILPACRDEANQVIEQGVAKKHSRTLQVSTPDEAGGARAMLVANQGTKDFYVHWSAGDKVQIFCQQGQHFLDLGSFPLEHIAEDKRSAQLNVLYPDVIDLAKPYTLYGVYGAAAKYTPIGQSVGGKHTADEGLVFDASPIIGKPVADFRPPLYFKQEIDPKVSGNALQFAHYGTYEIVKMENASKQAVRVLAPQLASATDELWYAHPASNKSNLFLPSKGATQEASLLAAHQAGAEQILQSGESRVFVNWYRPTDTPLTKAKLVATIDGVKQTSTERALPKAMTLQVGRAYHLTAVWDGKKLTYDQVEEEMSVDKSDLELTVGEIAKISLRGAKNPRLENSDDKVMDAKLVDFVEHNGTLQIQGKTAGRATLKVIAGGTMLEIKVTVQEEEPNNPFNGKNIVWDKISSDDYELSADGLTLIKWKNKSTRNLDMNRDSRLRKITVIGVVAFDRCSGLTSVIIPSSVTSIGRSAFEGCSSLTSVTIPSSVTSIEHWAFGGCSSLTSVTIPSSVTSIGMSAFDGCSSLTSVTIPSSVTSIGAAAFYNCSRLTSITIPSSVTSIEQEAFRGCSSLTSVTIPSSVTSIGGYAFWNCSSLTSVTIPSSVTSIEHYAFHGCSRLTSITIPSSVTSIGAAAFFDCSSLTSVTIPSSVTSIGEATFSGCSRLTSITIPSSVTSIEPYAFSGCSRLTSVNIPSSVTSIGGDAFRGCSSLTSIHIPSSVTSIGEWAFGGCSSLTSVTIPSSVTSIGMSAFDGCSSLTSVTIPSSVTSIGAAAFQDCSSLTSVTIPSSVRSIGERNFEGCSRLTRVVFKGNKPPMQTYSYYHSPVFEGAPSSLKLIVPKGSKEAYREAGYPADKLVEE